ncbi:MAG: hypothetical protein ACPLYD_07305 [Anaerolineae bacterium]|jgi:hypothetical protein
MVNPEVVASFVGNWRGYLEKLRFLAAVPQDSFLNDFIQRKGSPE